MTLTEVKEEIDRLKQRLENGCSSNLCVINPPKGMATNGPCRCSPRQFAKQLKYLAEAIEDHSGVSWKP